LVERGEVALHGAYFGVATGGLLVRDPASGEFLAVAADQHARALTQPRF
jgi:carbonic anhydrase